MNLEKLKEFRKHSECTKLDLSIKIGIPYSTYFDKENGKTSFKLSEFIEIVKALGLNKEEVFELLNLPLKHSYFEINIGDSIMDLKRLKKLRLEKRYTHKMLSSLLNMSVSSYSKREKGIIDFKIDEFENLSKILELNEIEILELLGLEYLT
ncbi:TPA: helix-turn-helix transcriptional regulator [Clostridioides difficile]|nr:helix-turn-helix transcriptional regulator [Clostridioides difficile]